MKKESYKKMTLTV